MIIWITGISGSGKSTIANELIKKFKKKIPEIINVDGDEIRELFLGDLSYAKEDRIIQIQRIQRLCLLLEKQNQFVIASALYANNELLAWNRNNFSEYYEIYLNASIKLVSKNDVKGLYKKVHTDFEKNVVGVDIKWNIPKIPDLVINRDSNISIKDSVEKIIKLVPRLRSNT